MKGLATLHASFGALALVLAATPATGQYSGFPYDDNYRGSIDGPLPRAADSGRYGDDVHRQIAINQCASAAQLRLGSGRGGRVVGISEATFAPGGGLVVRGVATSQQYGYGFGMPPSVDLVWQCRTDWQGFIREVRFDPARDAYAADHPEWTTDYSQFGYRRY